ncbi:four helix bundle protein [Desulfobacter vibrioformis]|uniref:four helix bundle protein n=1 Tax=Desulfobacter vibrioformis TaxID=34031 RepID=UPI000552D94F|nr:four helix bundle protein [Desulfobacter vibrioformis]
MPYKSFEDLNVWKQSCRLTVRLYRELKDCRDFGLKDQMTRAAVSIASNIAEGAERDSKAEFTRFLHIAKGSAAELRTQIYISMKINMIPEETAQKFVADLKKISAMLHNLIKTLKSNAAKPQN